MRISDWSSDVCSSDLRIVEQYLDVDFVIGGVHPGRVVDEIGIKQHARHRRLDATTLGQAKIAALANHLAAQRVTIHAQRVVGAIADIVMAFAAGLDVGADAAVPEQVDRRPQNGIRSEEHTSELQSLMRISYAVFCLKKKIQNTSKLTYI